MILRWNSGPLIGISWTHADDLLCIQEDGQILLYNVFCQYQKTFTMGKVFTQLYFSYNVVSKIIFCCHLEHIESMEEHAHHHHHHSSFNRVLSSTNEGGQMYNKTIFLLVFSAPIYLIPNTRLCFLLPYKFNCIVAYLILKGF